VHRVPNREGRRRGVVLAAVIGDADGEREGVKVCDRVDVPVSGTPGTRTYGVRVLAVPASSYTHGSAQPVVIARRLSHAYLDCQAQPSQPRAESRSRASWLSWHCTQPAGHRAGPHFTDLYRSFTESSRQNTRIRPLRPLAFQQAPPSGVSPAKCLTPGAFRSGHTGCVVRGDVCCQRSCRNWSG